MTKNNMLNINCQYGTVPGTPKGILAIITIGDKNGIRLAHVARLPDGLVMAFIMIMIEIMMGIVIGN